ncbi:hypothetical protein CIT292_08498 [Citrobacter youngae ATCC 29220]|uniref:Uncharacterized protein n=1 Tax=Citrobacter youngae ATCC 29220 TaxID=500640 RepID=D4BDD1_9ENTR|nr:hypothetical protein CIT292_08498 [Citrobacter youngae ATCC 29220]
MMPQWNGFGVFAHGFAVVETVMEEPHRAGYTVWLAQKRV